MFENLIRQLPAQATLFALGMRGTTVVTALVVFASFALLGHSNLRLGGRWIELVFVTPRLHRLHHLPATTQRNFGTILTIWDRIFGRFAVEGRDARRNESECPERSTTTRSASLPRSVNRCEKPGLGGVVRIASLTDVSYRRRVDVGCVLTSNRPARSRRCRAGRAAHRLSERAFHNVDEQLDVGWR